ncbi:ABC protein [Mucidula mucida]|nr:ABC protein [Mucidula mucida]
MGAKDEDEKVAFEESQSHTSPHLNLDAGDQIYRIRTSWWKLWLPKDPPPPPPASLSDAPVIPIVNVSLFSKLTYSWITPLMVLGYQRTLQAPDLWKVDPLHEAGRLSKLLDESWERRSQKAESWNARLAAGELKPSYFKRMRWSFQCVFGDTAQLMGPLLVKAIINFAKQRASARLDGTEPPSIGRGIGMAIGLFCIVILASLTQHQFFWRSMTTGVLARAALINSIYKRGIMLSGEARTQYSNSALINHISTDVSRIDAASQWFHAGWTAPIQVTVCLIILLVQLGPSVLAGFLLFFLVAPIQERVMAHRFSIRSGSMKFTDQRAKTLLEVLGAMRIVKYFCYEVPFLNRIFETRKNELRGIRQMHHAQSANTAFAYSIPVLASTLAFVTYTSTHDDFDPAIIFASLSLFQLLRQPMMFLPRSLSMTADAVNALERLTGLFHAKLITDVPFIVDPMQPEAIRAKSVSFQWEVSSSPAEDSSKEGALRDSSVGHGDPDPPFRVLNVSLDVPRGCLAAIVGRVGSGKSSLLQGLIGEMKLLEGQFSFGGRVAYCPQTAWIQNATLKDNILFGQPFDTAKYWSVLERACLIPDLQMLPDGDLTEIGEKGINLSGGQKQRVNIARALYYDADVLIFDDPLSAVDAHVGKALFHDAILPLAKEGKTVLLVTHALHFLSHCDRIYAMDNGRIIEEGTYQQLISDSGGFSRLATEFGGHGSSSETSEEMKSANALRTGAGTGKLEGRLVVKEKRSTGSVSWSVYKSYLLAGRAFFTGPLSLLAIAFMQGSQILSTYTLVFMPDSASHKHCLPWEYFVSTFVSKNLHNEAVWSIFHATMAFFDTTPTGRIMGIFGKDIDSIDNQLPNSMRLFVITLANVLGSVIIITVLEYYFIIAAFIIVFGYVYFSSFYRSSAREMKRLDGMLRSLLYAHFSESLTGLPTIRCYGEIDRFNRENEFYIDLENRALLLTVTNQRWLAVRLDALGGVLVFCVAVFAVVGVSGINPAQIGLVLTYSTTLTQLCSMVTRQSAEVEGYMNAVERVVNFSQGNVIEQEAPHFIEATKPPPHWPDRGALKFDNVQMSYRPGLPKVLKGISMDIRGGEKIGIVGRTGAGKSSLVLALLRIVEFEGLIEVDGRDISKIGLTDLRTRMALIPQDPILFSGTVRTTLDPFSVYDDARLWDALKRSFLVESRPTTAASSLTEVGAIQSRITLDTVVETEGANFSVGQRSLLSLARALVKDTKIVILDEATASVDVETDHKIQQTIQSEFSDRTLLCIAHRLRTIISYDRVLVLDNGMIAEFDTPQNLFSQEGGIFRSLCEGSNISLQDILQAIIPSM